MKAKLVRINNTAERTTTLSVIDEEGTRVQVDLNPNQLLLLMQQGLNVISVDYNLVPRDD